MTVNVQKRRRYKIRRISRPPVPPVQQAELTEGQRLYILLTFIAAAGFFAGAYTFCSYGGDFSAAAVTDMYDSFIKSFCAVMIYIVLCFFSGLSAPGQAVGFVLCVFKGMGAGFLSAWAVKSGDIRIAADILPFEAISIVTIILAARENIRMSRLISRRSFSDTESTGKGDLRLYFAKFAVIMLTGAAAAAVDGIIAAVTGNMIN